MAQNQRELETKAHNYLIKNSYMFLKKLQDDDSGFTLKELIMQVYADAYSDCVGDGQNIPELKSRIQELEEYCEELRNEIVKADVIDVKNL